MKNTPALCLAALLVASLLLHGASTDAQNTAGSHADRKVLMRMKRKFTQDGPEDVAIDSSGRMAKVSTNGGLMRTQRKYSRKSHHSISVDPSGALSVQAAAGDGVGNGGDNRVLENAHRVGEWGGSCTCPDGQVYQVGDNWNSCGSLACVGGTSGNCNKRNGPWANRKVICAGAKDPNAVQGALEVMSYNTEFSNYNARMGGYASKIREVGPAIVGLQECQNRDGIAGLAGYTAVTGNGNTILYDPRKVTKVSDGQMRIKRDDYAERFITWMQLEFKGQRVWFFNTHLPHNHNEAASPKTHAEIARKFLEKRRQLGAESTPTIMLGDMNSHASHHNKVAGGGFESNLEANGFTLAYTARGSPGYGGIDHILYSTAHWNHHNCRDTGTGGSDHTSITCDLVLKGTQPPTPAPPTTPPTPPPPGNCDDTPAPVLPDNPSATCGGRWQWLVGEGDTAAAAKCKVKEEEPVKCSCLTCAQGPTSAPPTPAPPTPPPPTPAPPMPEPPTPAPPTPEPPTPAPPTPPPGQTNIRVDGRSIMVNGKKFHMKGVNWNPVRKGGKHPEDLDFRGFVVQDSWLMKTAGVNVVRTYEAITDTSVLDTLWGHGIYVIPTVYGYGANPISSIAPKVDPVKDHPAILMWAVGNEWNYNHLYRKDAQPSMSFDQAKGLVRDAIRKIKQLDSKHPVTTIYGELPDKDILSFMSDADVWGINAYRGIGFGNLFKDWESLSGRPMYFGEYGADAFDARVNRESQGEQAKATTALTNDIVAQSTVTGGVCSGGIIFEFADEWWKAGEPDKHDTGGVAPGGGPYPDMTFNEEWWGLVDINRRVREAFDAFTDIDIPGGGPQGPTPAPPTPPPGTGSPSTPPPPTPPPPTPPPPAPPPSDCTGSGQDPFQTGSEIKCCDGLDRVVKDWDNNGKWYFKCITSSGGGPSPPTPRPPVSGGSCSDQWNNKACKGQFGKRECHTCGERIEWLKNNKKLSDANAKQRVADEFFAECGSCGAKSGDTDFSDEGYSLVWQDDFDGNGAVDASKWKHVEAGNGFGNNELQFYTKREVNSFVRDGMLTIRAKLENYGGREYTSAKLESHKGWKYGKFHVRARLKYGVARGTWAANWMMPKVDKYGGWPRSGEIDIMEHVGYDTGTVHGTVHTQAYHHNIETQIGGSTPSDVSEWHTYMIEWRPDIILFGMDNGVYQIFRKESDTDTTLWPFKEEFYLILNMAVGGNWGGKEGIDKDAFRGDGQKMEVDWVKVYQKSWR